MTSPSTSSPETVAGSVSDRFFGVQTGCSRSRQLFSANRRPAPSCLEIPVGSELVYIYDSEKKCKVTDTANGVEYDGRHYTLSGLSKELTGLSATRGPSYFFFEGELLTDRRDRLEREMGK